MGQRVTETMRARSQAETLLLRAQRNLRDLLPREVKLMDAHTHLGVDADGMCLDPRSLLAEMEAFGISRALVLPFHETDWDPDYRRPNDRLFRMCEKGDGRLVPLTRVVPTGEPLAEARRCLRHGSRGFKLHPRSDGFPMDDLRLDPVFELAAERRVPVLIHAGPGVSSAAETLARRIDRHPDTTLILAHAAINDQAGICQLAAGRPNLFFDTSAWSMADIASLLAEIAPEQVLYASDMPYGRFVSELMMIVALLEELEADEPVRRGVLGGTLEGILRGELPQALSSPLGPRRRELGSHRQRLYAYLSNAIPLLWAGRPDTKGFIGLALTICRSDATLEPLIEFLEVAARLWSDSPGEHASPESDPDRRTVWILLQLAEAAAFTPSVTMRVLQ